MDKTSLAAVLKDLKSRYAHLSQMYGLQTTTHLEEHGMLLSEAITELSRRLQSLQDDLESFLEILTES